MAKGGEQLDTLDGADQGDIRAVSRVARILGLFGLRNRALTAAEIAERLGLNRTTTYRYCNSMVNNGLLERDATPGAFALGGVVFQLGVLALSRRRVIDLAPRHLTLLAARVHSTAVLGMWGALGPVVSRVQEDPRRAVVVTVRVGTQLSLDSAQSKVFLAFHPDQLAMRRLVDGLPGPKRLELLVEVDRVRDTGLSVTTDRANGLTGIAAPVFDEYGICATVAVLGTERVLPGPADSAESTALRETAATLTKEMGGPPPST